MGGVSRCSSGHQPKIHEMVVGKYILPTTHRLAVYRRGLCVRVRSRFVRLQRQQRRSGTQRSAQHARVCAKIPSTTPTPKVDHGSHLSSGKQTPLASLWQKKRKKHTAGGYACRGRAETLVHIRAAILRGPPCRYCITLSPIPARLASLGER